MSRIDPSIPLGVKTPQPNDTLETYGRVLQMRNLLDAGKINKQNMQMNDENLRRAGLENDARERAQKGQQLLADNIKMNTNLNEDGSVTVNHATIEGNLTRAGYPDVAKQYNADHAAVEDNEHKRVMNQLEEHGKKVKQLGQMSQSILNASPDLRPGLYAFAIKQAQSAGLMTPEELQQLPPQYQGEQTDAMLQQMSDHAAEDPTGAMIKRMQEKRAADEAARKAPGETAEALQKQLGVESNLLGAATDQASWERALSQLPEDRRKQYKPTYTKEAGHQAALMGLTAEQRSKLNEVSNVNELALQAAKGDKDAQKALDILKKREIDIDAAKALGGLGSLTTGPGGGPAKVPMTITDNSKEEFLNAIPEGARAVVKGLTDYRLPLPTGMALRTGYWQKMLELANQYDPSFDVKEYSARQRLLTSFKSGGDSDNIKSINTAVAHLDRLMKAAKELDNYKDNALGPATTLGNAIANAMKSGKGAPVITRFRTSRSAVKSELTRAFRGTGGSVDDVKDWENNFSDNASIDAQKAAGKEAVELLAGRLKAIKDKFETGMNRVKDFDILTPESRKIIQTLGIDPNTIETAVATAPAAKGGSAKVITPDLMAKARAANKGASDEDIMKALETKGYRRP